MKKSQWSYKKAYRIKRKRHFFRNKFFWGFFVFLLVTGGIFYFLFFSSFFQIKEIQISGNRKIPEEILKSFIEKKIQNKALIFSTQNFFLADSEKIGKDALESFILLDEIKIEKKLPGGLSVNVEEKKPAAVLVAGEMKFFIDKKGVVFEQIVGFPAGLPHLEIEGLSEGIVLGKEIIDGSRLAKIIDADTRLKADLEISAVVFRIVGSDKLIVETQEGWEFYLNLEGDVDWQLTKLRAVLKEKIPPERRRDLEYVELRFGNFAPYKFHSP